LVLLCALRSGVFGRSDLHNKLIGHAAAFGVWESKKKANSGVATWRVTRSIERDRVRWHRTTPHRLAATLPITNGRIPNWVFPITT